MSRPIKTMLIIAFVVIHICLVKSNDLTSDTQKQRPVPGNALAKKITP
ncbi:hypothetical protein HB364_04755 [Pseudoflavitalea sp. X16]|nr:hypothetical protein [Paraflavitalea devenefica]NII24373.1 hypothetical protein [Paraflavitalea devenefica]